jgi:sorting nexin-13
LARSVSGALGGLVLASTALALVLSQTSARFAANLPVAVAVVWATHALARVRVDARWDTRTRRLHVSVTRQRARDAPGTHDDAPGASRAFSRRDADSPLAGETRAAASESERTSTCSPPPSLLDATQILATSEDRRAKAFPLRARTRREAELRDVLRACETRREEDDEAITFRDDDDDDDELGKKDDTTRPVSCSVSQEDDHASPPSPSEPGLLGSWARLRDRVVREFVTDLWYAPITPDAQFPNAVSRVLDVAFAELAHRARRADLAELLLETAPVIVAENLERFRSAREVVGGVDAYVRRTPREADAAMAPTLWPRELFGDASLEEIRPLLRTITKRSGRDEEEDTPPPLLAAFETHARRVFSARCVAVADALLNETEMESDPLVRPLARELLVGCLLRPLLGFFSPYWAHKGLAALLAAEDDIAAAGGGDAPGFERDETRAARFANDGSVEVSDDESDDSFARVSRVSENFRVSSRSASPERTGVSGISADSDDDARDEILASSSSTDHEVSETGFVVLNARVTEAHIAGKGASAYAVYTVRVRARVWRRTRGEEKMETEKEWVVPRRFRNFEALHRRCEKEAGVVTVSSPYAPLPALPKKRFVLNSLDGAFVEARRALLDQYLVALTSCPARAASSRTTRAFLDQDTVTGPFAPEPDTERHRGGSIGGGGSLGVGLSAASVARFVSSSDPREIFAAAEPKGGAGERRLHRRPPAVPRAESLRADTERLAGTSRRSGENREGSPGGHRRRASSGAVPGAFAVGSLPNSADVEKLSRAPPRMARRSFPDLTSSFGLNEKDAFGSTTSDDERDRERLAWDASATERARTGSDAEASATTALDSLARGGLLRLFESTFHLRAKGLVRRTIVAAARQTLEFFVGAAVEDLAAAKLRLMRSPETAKKAVDLVEQTLWPGGVWFRKHETECGREDVSARRADEERVRLKVRDALLASWSRGPLYSLVGARNCTRAGLDVLGAARSELLCARVGLEAMLAALDAAFPESKRQPSAPSRR